MKKKLLLISLLTTLLLIFAACGSESNESSGNTDSNTNNETSEEAKNEGLEGHLVSEEPLELSIHLHYDNKFAFNDDWLTFNEAAKATNVSLKTVTPENATNSEEVFNLVMSGNIPDIVHAQLKYFNQYGPEGAFIPLNDLIEEQAPNIKKYLDENPLIKKYITSPDGNIYALPFIRAGNYEKAWYLRTDWLEKLGLEEPKTAEEYYNVLKAFKTQDPNGNGKADEIPFAGRNFIYMRDLLYLWGAHGLQYFDGEEIKYGPMEDEYKEGVANLAKWYAEGLIDPEIFTRGQNSLIELAGQNVLGATHDWFPSTADVNRVYKDEIPGFAFTVIAPPVNTKGEQYEESVRDPIGDEAWAISINNKYPEETMRYFDYFFTEEGRMLMNYGVEGVTYTMEDGKPVFTDEVLNSGNVPNYLQGTYGVQVQISFPQDEEYEKSFMHEVAAEGIKLYDELDVYYEHDMPILNFTPEEQQKVNSIRTNVETFINEKFQEWVLGNSNVEDEFDDFRQTLIDMGIEEFLEIHNTALKRMQEN